MPTAYTPGLTIAADTVVREERVLPIPGEVLVAQGQPVDAEAPVARAERPGNLTSVKVSERLGVEPADLASVMLKSEGDPVAAGEVIAETRAFFGLFHNVSESPVRGVGMPPNCSGHTGTSTYFRLRRPISLSRRFARRPCHRQGMPSKHALMSTGSRCGRSCSAGKSNGA